MYENIVFSIANFLFLISSYPMIKNVLKNKSVLNGYSFFGAILTFLGIYFMIIGFILIRNFFSVLFVLPTFFYWFFVIYYLKKYKR